jgi:3-deoxy-7-phosphoheptulonate synthase
MIEATSLKAATLLTNAAGLRYGVSVTDACLSWEVTQRMLREGAKALAAGGSK